MPTVSLADLQAAALRQPGAARRQIGIKFQCPECRAEGHDKHRDNACLFDDGRWGCAWAADSERQHAHRRAIGLALGAFGNGLGVIDADGQHDGQHDGHDDGAALGDDDEPRSSAGSAPTVEPYTFTVPVPPGHFLADYIAYASARTDAAHELHESAGLGLLSAATPNVRAMLAPYPGGLGTNLYQLVVAESTLSRKSTAAAIARDLHEAVIPGAALADLTSPEAFIEQLARRPGDSTTWFVDEVGDLLDKLHHAKFMAGMRGLLLTVYGGQDYRYTRHSKRVKGGATVEDEDFIRQPHLSVLGATTPAVFDVLTVDDVRSGLLPRFAVIMPSRKPPRAPFYGGVGGWNEGRRAPLAKALHTLYAWACSAPRAVAFSPGTLEALDDFAAALEREAAALDEASRPMLHRLAPMAVKVGMLVAAGRPETPDGDCLTVTLADAAAAVAIAARWRVDAVRFAGRIGETEFERLIVRCLRLVTGKGRLPRRFVAQGAHVEKRVLDRIEETLVDRGEITVERIEAKGRPTLVVWRRTTDG